MSKRRMRNVALAADNTLSFNQYVEKRKTVTLIPKSLNQETYIELLTDPNKHIVFAQFLSKTSFIIRLFYKYFFLLRYSKKKYYYYN